jgi:hypothetical protein
MTFISTIATYDRIIITADGKSVDTDTQEVKSVPKIFRITDKCALAISGRDLLGPQEYTAALIERVGVAGITNVGEIAEYINRVIRSDDSWKDGPEPILHVVVAGYSDTDPVIIDIRSYGNGDLAHLRLKTLGGGDGRDLALLEALGVDKDYSQIWFRDAEQSAIRLLCKVEDELPDEVGEQEAMWHIFSTKIETKSAAYTERLRKKYGKMNK